MNVMARHYKPTATSSGTVRPLSASTKASPARAGAASPKLQRDSPNSFAFGSTTPPSKDLAPRGSTSRMNGFDYEGEIRRLTGHGCGAFGATTPSASFTSIASARSAGSTRCDYQQAPGSPTSPSRFRWVQPRTDETLPPKQRPELNISSASKARNAMYRPVITKEALDTTSHEWRALTAAERAAHILQGRA
jgi:hypothetical protein